jgi:integrase
MRGQGHIYLRGRTFWASYYLNGEEFRESTKQTDPHKAEKFLKDKLDEVGADRIGAEKFSTPKMNKQTVGDLLDALKCDFELRGKASAQNLCGIRQAKEYFGHRKATVLRPAHIDEYIKEQLAKSYAPATINRVVQYVEQSYSLALKQERISRKPYFRRLSEQGNARQGFVEESTFRAIHAHLPEHLKDFIEFMYVTGMRRKECKSLSWRDVDGDCLKLLGQNAKNGRTRIVPMIGQLGAVLERRRQARQFQSNGTTEMSALIFHKDGRRIGEFRKSWATACDKAGMPGILVHDLRRSAVRNLDRAGVRRDVARAISGHRTDSLYSRYNITSTEDVRAALAQTEAYREATRKVAASNVVSMAASK